MSRPGNKGAASGFAAAAKVLFDSAQKSGAVKSLETSTKEYAQQLKKIQSQSRKRGGSLGNVSYKVAEFLATQRATNPLQSRPSDRTIATKVPLIDLPEIGGPLPTKQISTVVEAKVSPISAAPSPSSPASAPPKPLAEVPAPRLSPYVLPSSSPAAAPAEEEFSEIMITEDSPLFEVRSPTAATPMSSSVVKPESPHPVTKAEPSVRRQQPIVHVPIPTSQPIRGDPPQSPKAAETILSVDMWELQREKEIARLQQKQDEAEKARLTLAREEEHKTLGAEWVQQRSCVSNYHATPTEEGKLLFKVYSAQHIDDMMPAVKRLLEHKSRAAAPLHSSAAIRAAQQISCCNNAFKKAEHSAALLEAMETHKIHGDTVAKVKMTLQFGDNFIDAYRSLSEGARKGLESRLTRKAVTILTRAGHWEEAVAMVANSHSYFTDRSARLELALLRSSYRLDAEVQESIASFVSGNVNSSDRMNREIKLALASHEKGRNRVNALEQLSVSPDADECVYAELILRSSPDAVEGLLAEMEKRGMNKNDPSVMGAIAMKVLDKDKPLAVFQEIDRQVESIGVRPIHLRAAVAAVRICSSPETLQLALPLVEKSHTSNRIWAVNKLLPRMFDHDMHAEIVRLADHLGEEIPLSITFPRAIAFINESLRRVGREPITSLAIDDINYVASNSSKSDENSLEEQSTNVNISAITEKMLLFAKEKQWPKALEVLETTRFGKSENSAAVTLIYNCALSAAVDNSEVGRYIYNMMRDRNISTNSTSVNTMLSSLSRAGLWEEAIVLFDQASAGVKDNNTYLVQLSLLGKHNKWLQASAMFEEIRKQIHKPPISMFSLAIGATSSHDWSITLSVFNDMLKIHGANVKDSVVTQVVRCLEQNQRSADIITLEREIEKRRKKKKK